MVWTCVVAFLSNKGLVSGVGAYWRLPGFGGFNGVTRYGE